MKNLFILLFFSSNLVQAQFSPEQLITNTADGVRAIVAVDVDGDSFMDIVAANKFGSSIAWVKNQGAAGGFGELQEVRFLNQTSSVDAGDLDGDGDIDLVGISAPDNTVKWFENVDGQGTDWSSRNITVDLDLVHKVRIADIDGDGDNDVVASSDGFDKIVWFENTDEQGQFSGEKLIGNQGNNGRHFFLADVNGDTFLDVVASNSVNSLAVWYANLDGLGNYGTPNPINPQFGAANDIFVSDLNGDASMDVLTTQGAENEVAWYPNLDGAGDFTTKNVISNTTLSADDVYARDLDNDGDIDVISSASNQNEIAWYENLNGLGDFSDAKILSSNGILSPNSVRAADLDNDGDIDIIACSQNEDKIVWYENLTILSAQDVAIADKISIYPNPTQTVLHINTNGITLTKITVRSINGAIIFTLTKNLESIDVSSYSSGVYFLTLEAANGATAVKKFVKE